MSAPKKHAGGGKVFREKMDLLTEGLARVKLKAELRSEIEAAEPCGQVTLRQYGNGWAATTHVPKALANAPRVVGQSTRPFLQSETCRTAAQALQDLSERVGEAAMWGWGREATS